MNKIIHFLLFLAFGIASLLRPLAYSQSFNIKDYGAIGDGKLINTVAIQSAIDACAKNGGGKVIIPPGEFLSGVIQLRSNITLYLENGAVLKGSGNLRDYLNDSMRVGLLFTKNCDNVMIKGEGIIDGNGDAFQYMEKTKKFQPEEYKKYTRQGMSYACDTTDISDGPVEPHEQRPYQMIIFSNCTNVRVQDVTIKNSPFWTLHLADCNGVVLTTIRILNNVLVANSDGIDCTSCSNVLISNCEIVGGDDAIVLNSYSTHFNLPGFQNLQRPSENITVSNCILLSRSSGIRIGGIDHKPMRNYSFNNITIYNSNRGIGVFTGIEGGVENCSFSDITIETRLHTGDWWGKAEPIHIQAVPTSKGRKAGKINNIRFKNIRATGESGIVIYGTEKGIISNVSFDGLDLMLKNGPLEKKYGGNFDLRPTADNALSLFSHDIPGIFIKNADSITIINSRLRYDETMESFFRYGIWAEDFSNLRISGFDAVPPPATKETLIYIDHGKDFSLVNSFLNVQEKNIIETKNMEGLILLENNHYIK